MLAGEGALPDGTALRWSARRTGPPATEPPAPGRDAEAPSAPKPGDEKPTYLSSRTYPAGAFGRSVPPEQPEWLLVRNATVWTGGPAGNLEGADLLVRAGKIEKVGRGLSAPAGAMVIDATGRFVTAGIIDCHSHTAVSRGVNEAGSSVTVEVRVADVIDPTDINLYRQLAGGVTTINVLHGSTNTMGGQNQVLKLRWGQDAGGLRFAGAKPGVKFALGENVTRAWQSSRTRYPISRMGVRETILDAFLRAADYERDWADFRAGRRVLPPRRDLRLEAAAEIARGERVIHIHSYRQDEVLMFIRLAEELKLPVATFQHILEGYKVAPEIAQLGAGASSFTDLGTNLAPPAGTHTVDVRGRHVYPGFISAISRVGLVEVLSTRATFDLAELGPVNPNALAQVAVNPDSEIIPVTRINGVLTAHVTPLALSEAGMRPAIFAGTSAVLRLDGWTWEDLTIRASTGVHLYWPAMAIATGRRARPADERWAATARASRRTSATCRTRRRWPPPTGCRARRPCGR